MIHLDTNVVIALINANPTSVRMRFDEALKSSLSLSVSVIVRHELMFGAANSQSRDRNEASVRAILADNIAIIPFDESDALEAADIRAHLRKSGCPIGPYDLLIAAQARRRGATLITANTREFQRVPGLQVVDWAM